MRYVCRLIMQLLAQLNAHEVRYLLLWDNAESEHSIGNFCVWIEPSHESKSRLLSLLANMGYAAEDTQLIRVTDFFQPFAFTLHLPSGLEVDIMTAPETCEPEQFEDFYAKSTPVYWEEISFHVVEWVDIDASYQSGGDYLTAPTLILKLRNE